MEVLVALMMALVALAMPAGRGAPRSDGMAIALDRSDPQPGLPRIAGSTDPDRPLVVIDPGHGGRDPGGDLAVRVAAEKDVTWPSPPRSATRSLIPAGFEWR